MLTVSLPQSLSPFASSAITYRWTLLLSLAFLFLILLWFDFIRRQRLSVLGGTVTVDGKSLPKFHVRVRQEQTGQVTWECARDFSDGSYVIYDVPQGELVLDLVWGPGNSCRTGGTFTNRKRRTFVDWEIPLGVEIAVVRTANASTATADVKCTFKPPTSDPPLTSPVTTSMKYTYTVSHADTQPASGAASAPINNGPQPWSGPNAGSWQSTFTTPTYPAPHAEELWSVEVSVDGAPDIKKKSKAIV